MKNLMMMNIILLVFLNVGCGSRGDTLKKEYRFYLETNDDAVERVINHLFKELNESAKTNKFGVVDGVETANSRISLQEDLLINERKLGFGQYIIWKRPNHIANFIRTKGTTKEFGISISFDKETIIEAADIFMAGNDESDLFLKRLFFHEIGHGLEMNHDDDPDSVMYYAVPRGEDLYDTEFENYFQKVRTYLEE